MKKRSRQAIAMVNYKLYWLALSLSLVTLLINAPMAVSDLTHDPGQDPIPTFDYQSQEKAIVVGFYFSSPLDAELQSVEIVPGPARGRAGEPALLNVEFFDLNDNLLENFNAWHPLWLFTYDDSTQDYLVILSEGTGYIVFPFWPGIAKMEVTDLEAAKKLVTVDLVPHLHNFCSKNPDDPNCTDVVNRPPTCDANGPYLVECEGQVTDVTLDGTSCSDPDGDLLSYVWTGGFAGGIASDSKPTVQFSGLGKYSVELNVTDDFGGTATCIVGVEIIDTMPPTIDCNSTGTIVPPDAPISFTVTATDICDINPSVEVISYDCFDFTKKGKRIDKKQSCIVSIENDVITILDSGGVGTHIEWVGQASDSCGNVAEETFETLVVNPAR